MEQSIRTFPPEPADNPPGRAPALFVDAHAPTAAWLNAQASAYLAACLPGLVGARRVAIEGELATRGELPFVERPTPTPIPFDGEPCPQAAALAGDTTENDVRYGG